MKTTTLALMMLALLVAAPAVAATDGTEDENALNCNGTPTKNPVIDGTYQSACRSADWACSFFDPCPI